MATLTVSDLSTVFPDASPPRTLKYFRNGIAPPASGGVQVARQLNTLIARRLRPMLAYSNVYGLHANFDSASTSDLACHRAAFRTGPTTTQLRWNGAFLPFLGSPSAADVTAYVTLTTGLTGSGTDTTTTLSIPYRSSGNNLSTDDLMWLSAVFDVEPDSYYRITLHRTNLARLVSTTIYEVVSFSLETDDYSYLIDPTSIYAGGAITQQQAEAFMLAADKVWRRGGHPLGWWTIDIPGDERSRTSATAANLWDQTVSAPTTTSPGWPTSVPYSGSLDSANVPVVFWCYADCVGGTGTVTFRDSSNTVLATINPVGAATWYSTTGNLTDNTAGAMTSKVDVFFGGDGTNACKVYAAGMFMDVADDPWLTEAAVEFIPDTSGTISAVSKVGGGSRHPAHAGGGRTP